MALCCQTSVISGMQGFPPTPRPGRRRLTASSPPLVRLMKGSHYGRRTYALGPVSRVPSASEYAEPAYRTLTESKRHA